MKRLLQVGVILMLAAAVFPSNAHAEFIFGAGVGSNTVNIDEDFDESDLGWKALVQWRFIKYFGIEVQYVEFGSPENDDFAVELNDFAAFGVGVLPVGDHFEFFGKFGYGLWNVEVEDLNIDDVVEDDEYDIVYGGGMAIVFGKHFATRLEYERFEVDETDSVDMASISLEFRL